MKYIGSDILHEILKSNIHFSEYHQTVWQVIVKKAGKFGIDFIEIILFPSSLKLIYRKDIIFKK